MKRDRFFIYLAAFFRSTATGLCGTIFVIYLSKNGLDDALKGLIISAGLAGGALSTLFVSLFADRFGRKRTLILISICCFAGGTFIALSQQFWAFLIFAFIGMLNSLGRDRHGSYALDQAIIPATVESTSRTMAFSIYNLIIDSGHAIGSLLAFLPEMLEATLQIDTLHAFRVTFLLYSMFHVIVFIFYFLISKSIELPRKKVQTISPATKKRVLGFSGLSVIDSLGSGFLTKALIAYWFCEIYHVPPSYVGILFAIGHIVNAASYPLAAVISKRIGLVNTMVFAHIPGSLILMCLPLTGSFTITALLYLLRELLVEMDVPTRQSYLMGIVGENERTFASGTATLARNCAVSVTPTVAGIVMGLGKSLPLFVGGSIKIIYDLSMWISFKRVRPIEEVKER